MTVTSRRRSRVFAGAAAMFVLAIAGCGASDPTLDERIKDLDAAIDLYQTVEGASCAEPEEPHHRGSSVAVLCEDGAVIQWSESDSEQGIRQGIAAALSDDGIDAVVGVNVTITDVDAVAVAAQIGGEHA